MLDSSRADALKALPFEQRTAIRDACSAVVNGVRRYHTEPPLPPCCYGDYRVWREGGPNYQTQMYCARVQMPDGLPTAINPNGAACVACAAGAWPRQIDRAKGATE
ncbi:MAG: hypothetical protein BWX86_00548 [Verrucomicrobia bacterium ADurb.Bin122]|nr:MAG: hypothetical protein BWX86_00548 [Verrucomicrobia bacterium ADurb.Bin122]